MCTKSQNAMQLDETVVSAWLVSEIQAGDCEWLYSFLKID